MSNLERVSVDDALLALYESAAAQPMVVTSRDSLGGTRILRQGAHERLESRRLEAIGWRQLPEKGPRFSAECQDPAREEVAEGRLAVPELEVVRDVTATLDGEHES